MEWALILVVLGFMFVVAEIFFPSFGMLSILAAGSFIAGVIFAFRESATLGLVLMVGIVVSLPLVIYSGFKVLPRTRIGKSLILAGPSPDAEDPAQEAYGDLLGHEGRTTTALRPSGIAEISGRRIDVVADGERIGADEAIVVIKVEGNRVVVERAGEAGPNRDPGQEKESSDA